MPFLESSQYLRPLLVTNLPPTGRRYRTIPLLQDCLRVRKHIFVNRHCVSVLGRVWLFVTLWTVALQAPLCMGFSRQEFWSGLPFPFSGIFLTQGSNQHLLCLLHCKRILYRLSHGEAIRHYVCKWTVVFLFYSISRGSETWFFLNNSHYKFIYRIYIHW